MKNEPLLGGLSACDSGKLGSVLRPGGTNCGGCGMSIAFHMLERALDGHRIQLVIPACCAIVTPGQYPRSAYGVPVVAATFASAAAVATGLASVAAMNGEPTRVLCWAGDGGTFDIGMATLSAAAERNEDVLYVCYDNEIYGNTGGQRSSATPLGARTSTTPHGKEQPKKDIVAIMAAHGIPYAASISLAHPEDAYTKFKEAVGLPGFRFIHVLAPCPTGWKSEPAAGIDLIRLAVRSGLFPVRTVRDGHFATIDVEPDFDQDALADYFARQRRFRKEDVDLPRILEAIRQNWERLRRLSAGGVRA